MNIFLFHRDLRLFDNTTLIKLSQYIKKLNYTKITPVFIFPPQQIDPTQNKYFSNNSVQFMICSLRDLNQQIQQHNLGMDKKKQKSILGRMLYFQGKNIQVLTQLHKKVGIKSIAYNIDYTPYAKKRDQEINAWALKNKIQVIANEDYVLYDILDGQTLSKNTNRPYLVFTPFKNFCLSNLKVRKPQALDQSIYFGVDTEQQYKKVTQIKGFMEQQSLSKFYKQNKHIRVKGGRKEALQILENIKDFKNYNKNRNYPKIQTTHLSAHMHFTTVSVREVYHKALEKLGGENNIISELHWRDFYVNITNQYPNVLGPITSNKRSFKEKFDVLPWKYNEKHLEAWKNGRTGFPIVDAAMNQMNTTGFMHNRCRMIVASFFAKNLFLDWRQGQQYFATKLVDYSPMQNSGGWQWSVGNGTDAQPYFRIFNAWTQQKTYDEDCTYIKKWLPILKAVPNEDVHKWYETCDKYIKKGIDYPKPIIQHDVTRKQTLAIFEKYLKVEK